MATAAKCSKRAGVNEETTSIMFEHTGTIADRLEALASKIKWAQYEVVDANGIYCDENSHNEALEMLRRLHKLADEMQTAGSDLKRAVKKLIDEHVL